MKTLFFKTSPMSSVYEKVSKKGVFMSFMSRMVKMGAISGGEDGKRDECSGAVRRDYRRR